MKITEEMDLRAREICATHTKKLTKDGVTVIIPLTYGEALELLNKNKLTGYIKNG